MRSVHYIIPTVNIGGAEKRFIEIWCYLQSLQQEFDLRLIISKQLHEVLLEQPVLYAKLRPYENRISIFEIDTSLPVIRFQKALYEFVKKHSKKEDILHFILYFPTYVFPLQHDNTLYSLTESSLDNVNIKGRLLYLLNIFRSRYSDILDPVVHKQVQGYFFFKRKSIKHTPGSFTDTDFFKPAGNYQKSNSFVFLGRFFYVKQVVDLLKAVPAICEKLHEAGFHDFRFIFLGYGQQQQEMLEILQQPVYKNLPVEVRFSNAPEKILAGSKVFFSVQLRNNYPSKSLLEAMSAGNIPLVTDVGTTRLIADPAFSYYVPEQFSANDISKQLISILSLSREAQEEKMKAAREFVINRFSINTSAAYYLDLYRNLAKNP